MLNFQSAARAIALCTILAAAGCQSVDELEPQAFSAPKNTGEFPKIGHIPVGETAQLGAGGASALRGQLAAARASQGANAGAPEILCRKAAAAASFAGKTCR